jgi:hypothetical protein
MTGLRNVIGDTDLSGDNLQGVGGEEDFSRGDDYSFIHEW